MTDVVIFQIDHVLRLMFVAEMIYELMIDSKILWKRIFEYFCDDLFRHLLIICNVFVEIFFFNSFHDYNFYKLNELLMIMKKILTNYKLFVYTHDWNHSIVNSLIDNETNYDRNKKQRLRNQKYAQLNENQLNCFNKIITMIDNKSKTAHFFYMNLQIQKKNFYIKFFVIITNFKMQLCYAWRFRILRLYCCLMNKFFIFVSKFFWMLQMKQLATSLATCVYIISYAISNW